MAWHLNCVANGKILRAGIFDEIWIQPAAGDAGGALGAAYLADFNMLGGKRPATQESDSQSGSFIGPEYKDREILSFLQRAQAVYHPLDDGDTGSAAVAALLAEEKIIGMFSGRMEFGPQSAGRPLPSWATRARHRRSRA